MIAEISDGHGVVETVQVHAAELDDADRDRVWTWIKENNGGLRRLRAPDRPQDPAGRPHPALTVARG
ncbi:hypothetical protein [Pseudonocardia sp. ICBG601]|uniref:hypothetical protein n=1 Tax=Pseudonocardia sp. ICBG601 TaxID=2846759 RepID=UPI001CF68188|nr:hypothetical protein [Pseudonocardia sp. ICBG601]